MFDLLTSALLALALLAQDAEASVVQPASEAAAEASVEAQPQAPFPPGAPRDPYGLVGWCYGALSAHRELRDEVMPEVVRIETTFRRPGSSLEDDLKVYDELDALSARDLAAFASAMEAAEKANPRPINARGADAIRRGRANWARRPEMSKARLAQEWMSWTLPARCEATAALLSTQARMAGAAFDLGEPDEPQAIEPAPATDAEAETEAAPAT